MKYFVVLAFLLPLVSASTLCPKGWHSAPNICYRLSEKSGRFRQTLVDCLTLDRANAGPNVNLIRVGQLRKINGTKLAQNDHWVRVDAFKDVNGTWREYLSRQAISFARYPSFNPATGLPGQTLIYNTALKSFKVVYAEDDDHRGLCYRQVRGTSYSCYNAGLENECSDNGDCVGNVCVCDPGYSGVRCANVASAGRGVEITDAAEVTGCKEFVRDNGALTCFVAETEGSNYQEAARACSEKGFKLAEVRGPKDQENIVAFMKPFQSAWLSLNDFDGDKTYTWSSGNNLDYTNWSYKVQDRDQLQHPCVATDPTNDNKWIDVSCDGESSFVGICEVY